MYGSIGTLYCAREAHIVLKVNTIQKQTNILIEKDQICGYQMQDCGEIDEVSAIVKSSGEKKNVYWGIMHNMINIIKTAVHYIWKFLKEQILTSYYKENF